MAKLEQKITLTLEGDEVEALATFLEESPSKARWGLPEGPLAAAMERIWITVRGL